jgi:Uma2 family endonuclease
VEILDQDDSEAYVRDFMTAVSAARVQLFWMVNPNIPSVIAVRPDRQDEMAILGDIVSGDPVFPDFQIPLPELVG